MDLTLVTKDSCENLSTWNSKLNDCEYADPDYQMETCCLGFRGDVAPLPILRYPFNTTYDFIDMIKDSQNDFLLKKDTQFEQYQKQIFLAIDFQNGEPLSQLYEGFLYNVFKTINDNNINIQLSYDGSIIEAYQNICKDNQCSEKQQYIANQKVIIQSSIMGNSQPHYNDVTNPQNPGESLVQNFNRICTDIELVCKHIPSWTFKYDLPLLLWEPSFEYMAQFVLQTFYNPETCPKPENYNEQKNPLGIVTNQQPEMMYTFLQLKNQTLYEDYPYGQKLY